jgi:hypothetical protein
MTSMANHLLHMEKAWLLSQIGAYMYTCSNWHALLIQQSSVSGLIPDCDDDVMDEVCFMNFPIGGHTTLSLVV